MWRSGCQAFRAKINLIHMRPVEILTMLYFAQNDPFYQIRTRQRGRDDLDANHVFLARARKAIAPGFRIARARSLL